MEETTVPKPSELKKNMFGDMVAAQPLTTKNEGPWLSLFRGDQIVGYVAKNGWTGKSSFINFEADEPVVTIFQSNNQISLNEMKTIIKAWEERE